MTRGNFNIFIQQNVKNGRKNNMYQEQTQMGKLSSKEKNSLNPDSDYVNIVEVVGSRLEKRKATFFYAWEV